MKRGQQRGEEQSRRFCACGTGGILLWVNHSTGTCVQTRLVFEQLVYSIYSLCSCEKKQLKLYL